MVCKKYQNEYKIFQEIVEGIMIERKSGLNPDDIQIKKIENELAKKYEVEL